MASVLDKYIKQVGSNTGAAVTPSGINAYNIDPRIGQQYQDLVSTVNSGISGQPAGTDVLSKYLTQLTNLSKPAPKKKNALQSILSNRAVQIGLKPLEVLDYGRRATISTLKESYDYGKTGEFNTDDFIKQIKDPTFGVGKFVNTGNKWADRGLGFLGDVGTDPTMLLTLGAGTFVGAGGRAALATKLLEAGASEALVSKAGKLGLAGLKSAEREAYNLPRAGLYLGYGENALRIPGTGLPGAGLSKTLAETRALLGSTPVGGAIRRARTPEAFIQASERLATGKGALSAKEATAVLSGAKFMAGAEGVALAKINQELTPIIDGITDTGNPAAVTYALERGVADAPMAAEARQFLDNNFARMSEAGQVTAEMYRPNYVPHVWSDAGKELLSSETQFARDFRTAFGVTVDDVRAPSAARARLFNVEPGKVYKVSGKELTFATDTIDEINRVFAREFPELAGAKVLEDDITKLLSGHARQTAQAVANGAFTKRLESLGVTRTVAEVSTEVVDKEATKKAAKAQAKATKKFVADMQPTVKAAADAQKVVVDEYNAAVQAVGKQVQATLAAKKGSLTAELDSVQKSFNEFLVRNKSAQVSLEEQGRQLDNMAEFLSNLIDNHNGRLSVISNLENSQEYILLNADKAYADAFLDSVKRIQSTLDDAIKRLDEATVVKLPTKAELGDEISKASRQRMLPAPKYVEPFRVIQGGEVIGRQRNAIIQFQEALGNARQLVDSFSPESNRALIEASRGLDEAESLKRRAGALVGETNKAKEQVFLYDSLRPKYDILKGVLERVSERMRVSQRFDVVDGGISALPTEKLIKLTPLTKEDITFIQDFERNVMPYIDEYRTIAQNSIERDRMRANMLQEADDLLNMSNYAFVQSKELALEEIRGMVDTPLMSIDVQNRVLESFDNLFEQYRNGIDVFDRLNSVTDLTNAQAGAAIKDAVAVTANIEEATFRFRIHADFTNRYKDVVSRVTATGQPFNADAVAALVAKEVLNSERKLAQGQFDRLFQAHADVIAGLNSNADALRKAGNISGAEAAARAAKVEVDRNITFINQYLQDYLNMSYRLNALERGKNSSTSIGERQMLELGLTSGDVGEKSLGGFYSSSMDNASKETLRSDMRDIASSLEVILLGTVGQREGKEFDTFKKFFDAVTEMKEEVGEGGRVYKRRILSNKKVKKWIDDNGMYTTGTRRYRQTAESTTITAGSVQRQGDAVAGAIAEQMRNIKRRIDSLAASGELLGYRPKGSADDRRLLGQISVDFTDPVAIAEKTAELIVRQTAVDGDTRLVNQLNKKRADMITKGASRDEVAVIDGQIADVSGELARTDDAIKRNREQYRNLSTKATWKSPTAAQSKRVDELGLALVQAEEELAKAPKRLDPALNDYLRSAEENLRDIQTRIDRYKSGASGDLRFADDAENAISIADAQKRVDDAKLAIEKGRKSADPRLVEKVGNLRARYNAALDAQVNNLRYTVDQDALRAITEQHKVLLELRAKLASESRSLGNSIDFNQTWLVNPPVRIKPKQGYAVRNWEAVLFSEGLGRNRSTSGNLYRQQTEAIRQQVALQVEARKALENPQRASLQAEIDKISLDVEKAGGAEKLRTTISTNKAELDKIDAALVKAKDFPDGDTSVIVDGRTKSQAKDRRKYLLREINKAQKTLDSLAKSSELGARIREGLPGIANESADTANRAIAGFQENALGLKFADAGSSSRMAVEMSEQNLAEARQARQQINTELDNTRQIGIDSSVATSEALVEVRDQISLVERNAMDLAQVPNVTNSDAMRTVEASNKWLDEALAMTSPQAYVDRVGFSARGGTLTGGTSEAQKFAFLFSMDATPEQQATAALVAKAHALEGQMLNAVENKQAVEAMVRGAKDMKFPAIMIQQMQDGFKEIGKSGIAVSPQIQAAMQRVMKLNQPGEWAQVWKVWDGYTDVFKAYATMSPRFHVRNALSATLMNYSDGVSTSNMLDGTKYWREIKNDPNGWIDRVPAGKRQEYVDAVNAVYASGGGAYGDFEIGTVGTRNRFVAKSKAIGTTIEGSVRMGMALDTIRRGGSFEEAVSRINRIHFNYSDVSKVDGYAKKIIPFWTFMSRNLPMQMQQMWLKPRVYAIYASAARNFAGEPDNNIVPSYQMDSGAFKSPVGRGLITPDLPWMKAQQDLLKLASPAGIVSNTTPLIKTPLELFSGKSSFTGAPINNPALYAAQQMLPMYQTIERLGGVGNQGARQGSNITSWLGIPYQQPTIGQQKGELLNRIALANQAIANSKK